ncbi:hypothetical protein EX30DRAFT_162725 [Ascodesmis nigricans]|uniref:Uncharacterized protein n=1 Tax=Ascodesmis nigricans TaxID=341454 RepID=A0A4S2MML1_9PEZI|nr:hypothetical protein EX30DRAFT_162725 [Ascodesmis nigricans]
MFIVILFLFIPIFINHGIRNPQSWVFSSSFPEFSHLPSRRWLGGWESHPTRPTPDSGVTKRANTNTNITPTPAPARARALFICLFIASTVNARVLYHEQQRTNSKNWWSLALMRLNGLTGSDRIVSPQPPTAGEGSGTPIPPGRPSYGFMGGAGSWVCFIRIIAVCTCM